MALNKGQLGRADHVNDQRLAPHGFHEPAGLEHGGIVRLHLYKLRAAEMICKVVKQHAVGDEDRAEHKIHEDVRCLLYTSRCV